jgi:phage regulator Rha-like protein
MTNFDITTKNDVLVVDSRLIADELGIEHRALIKTIKKYVTEIEAFGQLLFSAEAVTNSVGAVNQVTFCYLNEDQVKFIVGKSRYGLQKQSIEKFKEKGMDLSVFLAKTNKKRRKKTEKQYKHDLAKELNGKIEIQTLAGNIDILTDTEIIEVKEVRLWKHALGQVLAYGYYYPSHKRRIHLYGETQESFLGLIKKHCSKFNVSVTWEA